MGVQGLWQLLDPLGRPVTLESLENKILAVDVSIWLNQAVRGCRDTSACLSQNAHLQLLFSRICKLLHFRIKPVFVFDGGVPVLKKQTLASRRQRKETAAKRAHGASQKLLMNYIRQQAVRQKLGDDGVKSNTSSPVKKLASKMTEPNLFELPPLPGTSSFDVTEEDQEDSNDEWNVMVQDHLQHNFQDLDSLNLDSEEFQALPVDIRHEILTDCKDLRKKNSWAKLEEMPKESHKFSSFQMARLLKRRSLQQHIENVQKEISTLKTNYVTGFDDYACSGSVKKIMSEDAAHLIYLTGKKIVDPASAIKPVVEPKSLENVEKASTSGTSKQACNVEPDHDDSITINDDDDCVNGMIISEGETDRNVLETYQKMMHNAMKTLGPKKQLEVQSSKLAASTSSQKDASNILEKTMHDFFSSETYTVLMESNQTAKNGVDEKLTEKDTEVSLDLEMFSTIEKRKRTIIDVSSDEDEQQEDKSKRHFIECIENEDEKRDILPCTTQSRRTVEHCGDVSAKVNASMSWEEKTKALESFDSDSSDDFIEVVINPNNVQHDDLFPLEVFQNDIDTEPKSHNDEEQKHVLVPKSTPVTESEIVEVNSDHVHSDMEEEEVGSAIVLPSCFEVNEAPGEMVSVPTGDASEVELREAAANLQAEELELAKEAEKQKRTAALISDQMYTDSQELLRLFGIPFVVSPMEAEAQCATLDKLELVHGTITEDSDIWLFGGRKVYKNFFNQKKHVEYFQTNDIKHHYGLDQQKLIALAMLTGSDYTDGIEGIGCVSGMEILSEFPGEGIESLRMFRNWWEDIQQQVKIPQETKVKAKLRNVSIHPGFPNEAVYNAYLNPTVDESHDPFTWGLPDLDLLRDFAESNFGWNRPKTDGILLPLIKRLTACESQTRLDKFFSVTLDKTPSHLPSKRLRQAITKVTSSSSGRADTVDAKKKAAEVLRKQKRSSKNSSSASKGNKKSVYNRKREASMPVKKSKVITGPCLSEDSSASD